MFKKYLTNWEKIVKLTQAP